MTDHVPYRGFCIELVKYPKRKPFVSWQAFVGAEYASAIDTRDKAIQMAQEYINRKLSK